MSYYYIISYYFDTDTKQNKKHIIIKPVHFLFRSESKMRSDVEVNERIKLFLAQNIYTHTNEKKFICM